jgi:hypothetical protein
VLLCIAAVAICGWFFWLVPVVRRYDPLWQEQFTRKAYWKEVQKQIHRYGWTHDDFDPVGHYGDKGWADWIMRQAEAGQRIANCGSIGHKDAALKYITCSDPALGTNWNTEAQWLDWWGTNKNKSRLDWVQAGLRTYGVSVHLPLSETDYEPLLALLGNKSTNATEKIPAFVKYNAFRWLRDGGFEVVPFAMSNLTAQTPALVRAGIVEYGKYDRAWPKEDGVGRLELASSPSDLHDSYRPFFYSPTVQIGAYSLMTVSLLAGAVLLVYSCRHRKTTEDAPTTRS